MATDVSAASAEPIHFEDVSNHILHAEEGATVIKGRFRKPTKGKGRQLSTDATSTRLETLRAQHSTLKEAVKVLETQIARGAIGLTNQLNTKKREKCRVKTEIANIEKQAGIAPRVPAQMLSSSSR
jgi:hypothetical protein